MKARVKAKWRITRQKKRMSNHRGRRKGKAKVVNKRMEALIKESRALTEDQKTADDYAHRQYVRNLAQKQRQNQINADVQEKSRIRKRKVADNNAELFSEAILIGADDLKKREIEPYECRIDRTAWFSNTRFYPYFLQANADHEKFYTTPTTLCCVWCTEPCNTIPVPVPHRYSSATNMFHVSGQFCSFECMLAEARDRNKLPMAYHLMTRAYGIKDARTTYKPAPSRLVLQKFGGCMTYQAFRATSKRTDLVLDEMSMPFVPFTAGLQEVEKMEARISEYGDEEKTQQVVRSMTIRSRAQPLRTSRKIQKSKFAMTLTIQEQLEQSEQRMRLQMKEVEPEKKKKKQRTLRDFMIKE